MSSVEIGNWLADNACGRKARGQFFLFTIPEQPSTIFPTLTFLRKLEANPDVELESPDE